jgi:hypothetical protein
MSLCGALHEREAMTRVEAPWSAMGSSPERGKRGNHGSSPEGEEGEGGGGGGHD